MTTSMAGAAYDVTGRNRVAFLISAALNLLAGALLAACRPPRRAFAAAAA